MKTACMRPQSILLALMVSCLSASAETVEGNQASNNPARKDYDHVITKSPTGTVTLTDALALALKFNPELRSAEYAIESGASLLKQAGRISNPEIEAEVEEYDRDGAGYGSAETSVTLGMTIEMGGKRRLRKLAAKNSLSSLTEEYKSKKREVIAETTKAFMEVAASRERLRLTRGMTKLANDVHEAVALKVKAGKEPSFQAAKTEAELQLAKIDASEAERDLELAMLRLASKWGSTKATFKDVDGDLSIKLDKAPSAGQLKPRLQENPYLSQLASIILLQRNLHKAEKASLIPDLETSVGMQQYEEDGTSAIAFGIGIPIPLFDWNRGNVKAAEAEIRRAETELESARVELEAELADCEARLDSAYSRIVALETKVIPAMQSAFEAISSGYKEGKFRLLEMLDSQKDLYDAKGARLDTLVEAHSAIADIERLTGYNIIKPIIQENK